MIVDVTVFKGAGTTHAPEIVDPLSANNAIAVERGKSFLAESSGMSSTTLVTSCNLLYEPGDLVEVFDSKQGMVWYGKIISVSQRISLSISSVDLTTTLEVSRIP